MSEQEVAISTHRHGVWIELRLNTSKQSAVGITVGVADGVRQETIDEAMSQCKQAFEAACEDYMRLDSLTR